MVHIRGVAAVISDRVGPRDRAEAFRTAQCTGHRGDRQAPAVVTGGRTGQSRELRDGRRGCWKIGAALQLRRSRGGHRRDGVVERERWAIDQDRYQGVALEAQRGREFTAGPEVDGCRTAIGDHVKHQRGQQGVSCRLRITEGDRAVQVQLARADLRSGDRLHV